MVGVGGFEPPTPCSRSRFWDYILQQLTTPKAKKKPPSQTPIYLYISHTYMLCIVLPDVAVEHVVGDLGDGQQQCSLPLLFRLELTRIFDSGGKRERKQFGVAQTELQLAPIESLLTTGWDLRTTVPSHPVRNRVFGKRIAFVHATPGHNLVMAI